jgi:hypothetical protein
MGNQLTGKSREELKKKLAAVLGESIKTLSLDLQDVLLDDLVTALQNRLNILNRAHQNAQFITAITESVECETFQT